MTLEFVVGFIVSFLVFAIGFFVFQKLNYKKQFVNTFSIRQTFSFETHNFNSQSNIALRFLFCLYSICGITPFIFFFSQKSITYTLHVHLLIAGVFLAISILLNIAQFFTKTLNIKLFTSLYVFRMLTLVGTIVFLCIGIMTSISEKNVIFLDNSSIIWTFLALFILLFFVTISCFFNSKFFIWYKLEVEEDGQIKKPEIIWFCLYQWIFEYVQIATIILVTIFMYFI